MHLTEFDETETPRPAIKDNHPMVAGSLADGRLIYVAANADGSPMLDDNKSFVVIDPQTGRLRRKRNRFTATSFSPDEEAPATPSSVANPGKLPFEVSTGLTNAQRQISTGGVDNNEVASIVGLIQKGEFARTKALGGPSQQGLAFVLAQFRGIGRAKSILIAIVALTLLALKKAWRRVTSRFRKGAPVSDTVGIIERVCQFLSPGAQLLLGNHMPIKMYCDGDRADDVNIARIVAVRVPYNPRTQQVDDAYLKRFAAVLNSLYDRGVWRLGVSVPVMCIKSGYVDLATSAVLCVSIFTKQLPEDDSIEPRAAIDALNKRAGCDVFYGDTDSVTTNWLTLPW